MDQRIPAPPAAVSASCPYLGIREDPHTCLAYPAEWNLCHHARPVRAVSLEHQRERCLSPVYMRCPVFSTDGSLPLPRPFRQARSRSLWRWIPLAALLLLVAFGLWAAWRAQAGGTFSLFGALPTPIAAATPRAAFPVTFSPPAPQPGARASRAAPTATNVCGHAREAPIQGGGHVLVLQRVRRGESLAGLAAQDETGLKVLQAVHPFF